MTEEKPLLGENLENKIIEIMGQHPKGVSNQILQENIPSLAMVHLVESLNKLIAKNKIQILSKGKQLVYKLRDSNAGKKCQSADIEEKVVFQAVERSGNNGLTPRDLKFQCNLPQPQVTKILKSLESKKLVKCVTSSSKKKLYMLYDLEPSRAVTGGTFYSGQEFESEFVDVLAEQCYKYLVQAKTVADNLSDPIAQRNASFKSSKDICDYINSLQISKVNLSVQDIETILDALIYDAKIEKSVSMASSISSNQSQNLFRVLRPLIPSAGLMRMPCGVCLVFEDCRMGGEISPASCVYLKEWLDF